MNKDHLLNNFIREKRITIGKVKGTYGGNLQEKPLPLRNERLARQRGWMKFIEDGTALSNVRGKIICRRPSDRMERV